MNLPLISLEIGVAIIGVLVLLADLWTPKERKRQLGWFVVLGLAVLFGFGLKNIADPSPAQILGYKKDSLTIFFQGFFVMAGILVTLLTISYANRIRSAISEMYALTCFALTGMLFTAAATSFVMLFVAVELITITFYVLTSFERNRLRSLEAGVKYLILGAAASAIMVFGIALIYGSTGTMEFSDINQKLKADGYQHLMLFELGMLLLLGGLAFKVAAVPFQLWAPDVYQGAPTPVTAFLATGSKTAGFVLLLRVLHEVSPDILDESWLRQLLAIIAGATILYGSLCALRQRNLKRLLGYSGIASAGYALLGVVALNSVGTQAVLFYLVGYTFAVLAAFTVIAMVTEKADDEDISVLANLHQRSPLFAVTLTLAILSLAGVPPLAGFFGKFLLLKAAFGAAGADPIMPWVICIAIVSAVISLYYYFGIIREIYWGSGQYWREKKQKADLIECPDTADIVVLVCVFGMLALGLFPEPVLNLAKDASTALFITQ
ncbi:MAG: NADH-quinone oxidoreductase subunit N [Verrucomicrobiota bacterium]|jgi:NADH-quinone oxidoreductase subunit N|nr:NADH-quinone oxidoreductase subunit N [Verrucomicrobiota bacterium]